MVRWSGCKVQQRREHAMIQVQCPNCAKTYSVAEGSIGSRGNCASCGKTFRLMRPVDETQRSTARANPDAYPPQKPQAKLVATASQIGDAVATANVDGQTSVSRKVAHFVLK